MSYKIEQNLIPGVARSPLQSRSIIVAHESGNPNNTGPDSLDSEVNYMRNNWKNAFTSHWVGGGGRIVQIAPSGIVQYGAGYYANQIAYAQVELARTNNAATFKKDYAAYIWLLRKLAKEAGIPITLDSGASRGIKSHDWVRRNLGGTTHTDPYAYLAQFGITRAQFKKDVESGVAAPSANKGELTVSQYNELKKLIDAQAKKINAQAKEIAALKKNKQTIPNANAAVDPAHEERWKWAQKNGLLDGKNPAGHVTREQLGSVEHNFYKQFIANDAKAETYAEEAFEWADEKKVSDGSNPAHLASRQQVITITHRAVEAVLKDVQQMIADAQKDEEEE